MNDTSQEGAASSANPSGAGAEKVDNAGPTHRFLTVDEVAEQLRVKPAAVRSLLYSGDLVGFQVGERGLWRVERVDFDDYVSAQKSRAVGTRRVATNRTA
ncbi:hypothetical protein C8046_10640 [Serinibacter arcticus]|uniref:Helix-turn-helix domain-containing protein n=1 Tax=Serinibacter arcticus TaxID=1655435 RepID=A0A2U1ZVM0_9MICO|nr:helix-turn-helix domain-containing protein [Serinibacter arcticus]PWD51036.1 hypothetical protein C8046_10640 [Serinibacter arcticus]